MSNVRMIQFLHAYAEAKFGDEWWPGMARLHFTPQQIVEFADVLTEVDPDYQDSGSRMSYLDWLAESQRLDKECL